MIIRASASTASQRDDNDKERIRNMTPLTFTIPVKLTAAQIIRDSPSTIR